MTTNMWDERYAGGEYFFGTRPNAFIPDCPTAINSVIPAQSVLSGLQPLTATAYTLRVNAGLTLLDFREILMLNTIDSMNIQ